MSDLRTKGCSVDRTPIGVKSANFSHQEKQQKDQESQSQDSKCLLEDIFVSQ